MPRENAEVQARCTSTFRKKSEDRIWLKSLIWPEHDERIVNFDRVAHCFNKHALELIEGNGVQMLADLVLKIPRDSVLCIFHTHVANQIPKEDKYALMDIVRKIGKKQDIFHLYNNMWDSLLYLDYFMDGEEYQQTLAETDGHGRWFQWKL